MPNRTEYVEMSLVEAVRHLAEIHYAVRTRHLSHDEYLLLQQVADALEADGHRRLAFP